MAFMKIGGGSALPPTLPVALSAGSTFMLPAGQGIVGGFGGISSPQIGTNNPLSGQYIVGLGLYSCLQMYDAALDYWRTLQVNPLSYVTVSSDGTNYRLANTTGCPIGAVVTAAGSGGVNGFYGYNAQRQQVTIVNGITNLGNTVFTVAASAGGSLWNAIVGGAVNATLSFSGTVYNGNYGVNGTFGASTGGVTAAAGSGYQAPPLIVFSPPANQGGQPYVLPQAVCTITAGAIASITVTQQGAGLLGLPGISVVPQAGDTTGGGAVIGWLTGNAGQIGSGTVVLMFPSFYGTAQTTVPTFTYAGTSNPAPTATAIMNFTVTGVTNTTPGVGYTNAYGLWQGGMVVATPALNAPGNPAYDKGLSIPIFGPITVAATTGVTTLAGPFGGVNLQAAPTLAFGTQLAAGTVTTVAVQTPTVGGASDVCYLISI